MNTALWVIQILLAAFFGMTGFNKVRNTVQQHLDDGHLQPGQSVLPIRILGVLELLGCVGILLPWAIGVLPILTPLSAACFCMVMVAGAVVHCRKGEYNMLPLLGAIFVLAGGVACYRFIMAYK